MRRSTDPAVPAVRRAIITNQIGADMVGLENPIHILLLLGLLLLVFGAKRLPELGSSLGAGLRGFKQSITGESQPQIEPADPATGSEA
jgi:sec-independent protein translocase protein TatA